MSKHKPSYEELLLKLKIKESEYNRLAKKEDKYVNFDFFVKESLDLICIAGTDSYFKEINGAFTKVLGYSKKELLENSFLNFIHPDDLEKTYAEVKKIEQGISSLNFENRYIKKNGELVDLQWKAKLNTSNNLIYAIARDVTQIKKAHQKVELSEKSLNEAQKIAKTGSWEFNLSTNELKWSDSLYEIFEINKKNKKNLYQNYLSRYSSENIEKIREKIAQSIILKQPYEIEHQIILSKNRTKWVFGTGVPVIDENGTVVAFKGIAQDITEKKLADEAIKAKEIADANIKEQEIILQSNAKFKTYIENAPDGIFIVDENGNYLETNHAATIITGYSKKELLKMSIKDLTPKENLVLAYNNFNHLKENGISNSEIKFIHKKGEIRWWSVDAVKLSETRFLGFAKDVTVRKRYEEQLKESEHFLKEIQLIANLGTFSFDLKSNIWTSSVLLNNIFGIDSNFVKNFKSWTMTIHPDWREMMSNYFIYDVIGKKIPFDKEYKIIRVNDGAERWVHGIGSLKFNENKEIMALVGTIQDITERKLLEIELLNAKLHAENANKAKSNFLANMSHEIRTPLNGIIGFTNLLMQSDLKENQLEYMSTVFESATTLMQIINDILDFSRIESGKLELSLDKLDLFELLNQINDLFKNQAKLKNIDFILKIDKNVPQYVLTDALRLKQIIINLISNALKFTVSGKIRLSVDVAKKTESKHPTLKFSVKDTGIGIKKQNQKKIFESFVQEDNTTSRKFGGTGLGLAISNQLLQLMNSKLELKSEYGKGSNFYFKLEFKKQESLNNSNPESAIAMIESNKKEVKISADTIRMLIVEDNKINMFLAKALVKKLIPNCVFYEAFDGEQAINQFNQTNPDIILMDIQMPVMNGYETTVEIRKLKNSKDIPIIALTAGIMLGEKERCIESGMDDYISKPILESELESKLKKWLKIK